MIVSGKMTGVALAMQAMLDVERKAVRAGLRKGMNAATALILAATRAGVPEDSKALKKALGRRVKMYQSAVVGVIGARRDAKGKPAKYRRTVRRKGATKDTVADPAKYILLVERGTRPHAVGKGDSLTRRGKRQAGRKHPGAKANPFMMRAWLATEQEAKQVVMGRVAAEVTNLRIAGGSI